MLYIDEPKEAKNARPAYMEDRYVLTFEHKF